MISFTSAEPCTMASAFATSWRITWLISFWNTASGLLLPAASSARRKADRNDWKRSSCASRKSDEMLSLLLAAFSLVSASRFSSASREKEEASPRAAMHNSCLISGSVASISAGKRTRRVAWLLLNFCFKSSTISYDGLSSAESLPYAFATSISSLPAGSQITATSKHPSTFHRYSPVAPLSQRTSTPLFSCTSQFVTRTTVPSVPLPWLPHFQCGPRFTRLPAEMMPMQRPSSLEHGGASLRVAWQHVHCEPLNSPGCVRGSAAPVCFSSASSSSMYFARSPSFTRLSSSCRFASNNSSAFCRLPYIRISFLHRCRGYPNFSNPLASVSRMRLIDDSFSWIHRRAARSLCEPTVLSAMAHHDRGTCSSFIRFTITSSFDGSGGPSSDTVPICFTSASCTILRRSCTADRNTDPTHAGSESVPSRKEESSDQRSSTSTCTPLSVCALSSPCLRPSTYHRTKWCTQSVQITSRWKQFGRITPGAEYTPMPQEPSRRTKKDAGCVLVGSVCRMAV